MGSFGGYGIDEFGRIGMKGYGGYRMGGYGGYGMQGYRGYGMNGFGGFSKFGKLKLIITVIIVNISICRLLVFVSYLFTWHQS